MYQQALSLLTALEAAPSCQRLATSNLLTGCQSIGGAASTSEVSIEHARSIYAAQLAMCEILSAGSALPSECKRLDFPKAKTGNRGSSNFVKSATDALAKSHKGITPHQLGQCLQALESRPQWWTSYSNSRQNAIVMCKAAREEVAKGEYLA